MKLKLQILLGGLVAAFFMFVIVWWQWPDRYLHLVMCDVGQGDAFLLTYGFTQVLIDGGPDDSIFACLNQSMPWWDKTLELVIASHAHSDHIAGLTQVLGRYQVRSLLFSPTSEQTTDFKAFYDQLSEELTHQGRVLLPQGGRQWHLAEGLFLQELPILSESSKSAPQLAEAEKELSAAQPLELLPRPQSESSVNDESIALFMHFYDFSVLFTGDLEEAGEIALMKTGLLKPVTILKIAHHGSKTSTNEEFLAEVQPEVGLISSGKNNRYGHPQESVMERLKQASVEILRSDMLGQVEIVSDGRSYWVRER